MNPVVVIPTFIYPRRHRGGADVVSTYDHPTAPNQEGELGRCLESVSYTHLTLPTIRLV